MSWAESFAASPASAISVRWPHPSIQKVPHMDHQWQVVNLACDEELGLWDLVGLGWKSGSATHYVCDFEQVT